VLVAWWHAPPPFPQNVTPCPPPLILHIPLFTQGGEVCVLASLAGEGGEVCVRRVQLLLH
jgi:hypothetical protein